MQREWKIQERKRIQETKGSVLKGRRLKERLTEKKKDKFLWKTHSGPPAQACVCVYSVTQSCPTLCDPMDCSPPDSSVHGILQARIMEWVAMPSSRGSFQPRDWTHISCIASRFFTVWATREDKLSNHYLNHYLWIHIFLTLCVMQIGSIHESISAKV